MLVLSGNAEEAEQLIAADATALDEIARGGYALNRAKEDVLGFFPSNIDARSF